MQACALGGLHRIAAAFVYVLLCVCAHADMCIDGKKYQNSRKQNSSDLTSKQRTYIYHQHHGGFGGGCMQRSFALCVRLIDFCKEHRYI